MRSFLDTLFNDIEPHWLTLWRLSDKRSFCFQEAAAAASWAEGLADKSDLYVGVGLSSGAIAPNERCKAADISGIVGLWLDLDIADGAAHSKPNLPPSVDEAMKLARGMVQPSVIIHSGHGLQAWWLFREPWLFENDKERDEAAALSARWQAAHRGLAAKHGWDVDATQDLSRILRLPGTINAKVAGKPVAVTVLAKDAVRYNPSDLAELTEGIAVSGPANRSKGPVTFVVRENAPPPDLVEALRQNDKKFELSLRRERKDFGDQSASAYDLSLAGCMAAAGFDDQQIVDTLQWSHRIHRDNPRKHSWADYYARTLERARSGCMSSEIFSVGAAQVTKNGEILDPVDTMDKAAILGELHKLLGIRIQRVIRYPAASAEYAIQTDKQTFILGDVSGLIDKGKFRKAMADATGILMPTIKPQQWEAAARLMLQIREEESIGPQATRGGFITELLEEYLHKEFEPVSDADKLEEAAKSKRGFIKDGVIHIFGISLRTWAKQHYGEGIPAKEFGICMREVGARSTIVRIGSATYAVWMLPKSFDLLSPSPDVI